MNLNRFYFPLLELLLLTILFFCFNSFKHIELSEEAKINSFIEKNLINQIQQLSDLKEVIKQNKATNHLIDIYRKARINYKKIEFYLEYHFPFYSKYFINGPLVPKAEAEYNFKTISPHGYQVIEEFVYNYDAERVKEINFEIDLLIETLKSVIKRNKSISNQQSTIVDMLRLNLYRIVSMHLNGYDSTIDKNALNEVRSSMEGLEEVCQILDPLLAQQTRHIINSILEYINQNNNYEQFDRLFFISNQIKPLYKNLYSYYSIESRLESTSYAINIREQQMYSSSWLNLNFFRNYSVDTAKIRQQVELGKILFFDPILSGNEKRACASCHQINKSLASNVKSNKEFNFKGELKINTPSLLNVSLQKSFFHDGRSMQLEDQLHAVLINEREMNSTPEAVIAKLRKSYEYRKLFANAFQGSEDTLITYYSVLKSIAEFERTLVDLNLPIDSYLQGNLNALKKEEIRGYAVFAGKALCGSCHFFPLFNGSPPPFYSDNEFEVIGVGEHKNSSIIAADSGRFLVSKNPIHLHAIKTPGIRNFEYTGPYMHNGSLKTINEVVDFYNHGGGKGQGIVLTNQTLPFDSLKLTKMEIKALISFLKTLNRPLTSIEPPKKLPLIEGYEKRKIGGEY
ncbi:MAG: hypothetical protein IM600_00145 [Bacteroidetes bacterium]|nr:hypothetical protein [Bacteroidota bacterium]MCA6441809.1 hypothetical protein [Bacteroidota bacterium]